MNMDLLELWNTMCDKDLIVLIKEQAQEYYGFKSAFLDEMEGLLHGTRGFIVFMLVRVFKYSKQEIAHHFGVMPERISQIVDVSLRIAKRNKKYLTSLL